MNISPPAHNLERFRQASVATALLAVFPLSHAFTPLLLRDALPLCPFRAATGKPCPLCGMTRAIALATHRRWHEAFRLNPAWPLAAVVMIFLSILLITDAITGSHFAERVTQSVSRRWVWIFAALCLFGACRIIFGPHWNT